MKQCAALLLSLGSLAALTACDSNSGSGTPQPSSQYQPIVFEAEGGGAGTLLHLGEDLEVIAEDGGSTSYVTAAIDGTEVPETDARIATLEVSFPEEGTYELYARLRVGPGGGSDDSFYVAATLGDEHDWILVNGISGAIAPGEPGYEEGAMVELGGDNASQVWKWFKLPNNSYEISNGELVQTFRFAGREDGLDIDRFAFARDFVAFTVEQLEAGAAGEDYVPPVVPDPYTPPADQEPLAQGQDKFLGSVCCGSQSENFTSYFNQVTPENAGKWGSVEATRDEFNWAPLDEAVELAEANGFPFRFHVLVWGNQQPAWIEDLPPAEQLEEIQQWFNAVNARYGERLDFIEVVNEFDNDPPNDAGNGGGNYIEALGGTGNTGYDWILNAFRMARDTFPASSQLMINEYSVINTEARTDRTIELVELLQQEDLIDAIGFQAHAFSTGGPVTQMTANLDRLAATGLPLYATELDIDGPERQQLLDYQRVFRAIWEHPGVEGVTLWGYRPGMWRSDQGANLVYENGAEKMAMRWLKGYVPGTAPQIAGDEMVLVTQSEQATSAPGTPIATLTATTAEGEAITQDAQVKWSIVGVRDEEGSVQWYTGEPGEAFEIDSETGDIALADTVATGTYELLIHVEVNRVLSDIHPLQVVVVD